MLSRETFCEALRKIQAQKDRDEQFSKALALMGISSLRAERCFLPPCWMC